MMNDDDTELLVIVDKVKHMIRFGQTYILDHRDLRIELIVPGDGLKQYGKPSPTGLTLYFITHHGKVTDASLWINPNQIKVIELWESGNEDV